MPASPADAHKPDPVGDLWAEQERLRSDAVPGSRALTLTATRRKAIGRLLAAGYSTDDLRVCLVQYATEAKLRPASRQWFNGETNWVEANVARTLGRVGAPEATGPPANSHRPIRGQAPVSTAQHFDGDVPL